VRTNRSPDAEEENAGGDGGGADSDVKGTRKRRLRVMVVMQRPMEIPINLLPVLFKTLDLSTRAG